MANQETPHPNAGARQPDEARWRSDDDRVRHADRNEIPEQLYGSVEGSLPSADHAPERLSGVRPGPGPEVARESEAEDVLNRSAGRRYDTPRRYEDDADDPVLPDDRASLNIKI